MSTHLSTLTLHHIRYGDLDAGALQQARRHLDACPRCAARLEVQRRERAAFVAQPVPEALRRPTSGSGFRLPWRWAGALLVAAIALIVVVAQGNPDPHAPTDRVITKGVLPDLEVWAASPTGSPRLVSDDARLGEGDRVNFKYNAQGAAHVAFAGRDHTGVVEFYGSMPTAPGLADAPFGLVLDDAPGVQEFFVVVADRPLDSAAVGEAISGEASEDVRILRTTVRKESPAP